MHTCVVELSVVASSCVSVASVYGLLMYTLVSKLKTSRSQRVTLRVLQCFIINFEMSLGQRSTVSFIAEMVS